MNQRSMPIVALDEGLQREPDARRHVLGEGRGERRLRPLRPLLEGQGEQTSAGYAKKLYLSF